MTFKGYQVRETERGEDGVRLAKERFPKLVLMDIQLPGIDGMKRYGRFEPTRRRARSRSWR